MFDSLRDPLEIARMCIGTDRGRWWADSNFGSRLWRIRKEKVDLGTTPRKVREAIMEAVGWMQTDGLSMGAEVDVFVRGNRVDWVLRLSLPEGRTAEAEGGFDGV